MWASEASRNAAILAMLATTPAVARLWNEHGPTHDAARLLGQSGGWLSSGERVMLRAAFDLWNGAGGCKIAELLETLDEPHLLAVARAITARDRP